MDVLETRPDSAEPPGTEDGGDGREAPVWGPHSKLIAAYGDGTVARIRSGYEVKYSKRFEEAARTAFARSVERIAKPRLAKGKTLEQADGARIAAAFAAAYRDAPFLLASHDEARAPTRVKPRSWAHYARRFHAAAAPDGLMRLHACDMRVGRRGVMAKVLRTSFSWTRHAQTRLHQRTPDRVRADRLIADAILEYAGLLHLACNDAGLEAPRRFAIPCHEGLLCGFIGKVAPDVVILEETRCDTVGHGSRRFRDRDMDADETFVGVTYLGDDELWPDQRLLREAMVVLVGHYRPLGEALRDRFQGRALADEMPDAKGRKPAHEDSATLTARHRPAAAVLEATRALFAAPWARRAMGNREERMGGDATITPSLADAEGAVIEALAPALADIAEIAQVDAPTGAAYGETGFMEQTP